MVRLSSRTPPMPTRRSISARTSIGQFVYGFVARGFEDGGINNALSDFGPE
jgi:hypothetical protein